MQTIELTTYYDIHLHCPFCGTPATHNESGAWEIKGCNHLQLLTASDFVLYMSQRLQNSVEHAGYKVTRKNDEVNVYNPSDEDEYPDLIELVSKYSDVSIFEQVVGPPSLEVSHTVFAYNDDDYAKFNDTL